MNDFGLLILSLSIVAVVILVMGYLLYRFQVMRWVFSLRWALLIVMLLTIEVMFVNVWITSALMFLSEVDSRVTVLLITFAGFVALTFGYLVSSSLIQNIRSMNRAAAMMADGDLSVRMNVRGNDELAQFARTFNMMAEKLMLMEEERRALEQSRKSLVAWTSHDLRTPLTAIRVMIEAMNDKVVVDPATVSRYLNRVQLELNNLSRLTDALLEMAQLDAGYNWLKKEPSSLRDLISDTLGSMSLRAERRGIRLQGEVAPSIDPVFMAADKIQRVLNNLMDNAIRYTPSHGVVRLKAWSEGDSVKVCVQNTIDQENPPDISRFFTHFYRAEEARGQTVDGYRGTGLGLAIARGFVEAHGGEIWAELTPEDTIAIRFVLPRQDQMVRVM
jgi:signal transduction histidine kinase